MSNNTQASSTTAHFGLSQWAADDLIRREDFNHDLAAIDAALWQQAQTLAAAATAAQLTTLQQSMPEVILHSQTLSSAVNSLTIDLSGKSLGQFNRLRLVLDRSTVGNGYPCIRLNGDSASGSYSNSCEGTTAFRADGFYNSYNHYIIDFLGNTSSVTCRSSGHWGTNTGMGSGGTTSYYMKCGLSGIQSITLYVGGDDLSVWSSYKLNSGMRLTLYGRRA